MLLGRAARVGGPEPGVATEFLLHAITTFGHRHLKAPPLLALAPQLLCTQRIVQGLSLLVLTGPLLHGRCVAAVR